MSLMETGVYNAYIKANLLQSGVANITDVLSYKLTATTISLDVPNNIFPGSPAHVQIRRGAYINGVPTYAQTSKFFIKSRILKLHKDKTISVHIEATLFPENRITIAGDDTYENVITAFCAEFDKTAVFRNPSADYWQYQFLPAGKQVSLNNAMLFLNMLQQKFFIFATDNDNDEVLFYHALGQPYDDFDYQVWYQRTNDFVENQDILAYTINTFTMKPLASRTFKAVDENGTIRTGGTADQPLHNLGYLESTDAFPERSTEPTSFDWRIPITLRPLSGDISLLDPDWISDFGSPTDVSEEFEPANELPWTTTLKQTPIFANTAGGALPSTIERVANYTPLNTTNFDTLLSAENNNVQSAFDKLDDHDHSGLATTEGIQDIIGAMLTGNTETGIAVTYDDSDGTIDFVAEVTQAELDNHDHSGGDGAQIAYGSLSGTPVVENQSNDIYRADLIGASAFVGTINGAPSGASVAYNVSSGQENAMLPTSTSQLAKMRLYNTTRGNSALISTVNTGTNTITLTANAPGSWANGDTITIASQTVSGGGLSWIDFEITATLTGKSSIGMNVGVNDSTNANVGLRLHPFETFNASKVKAFRVQVANQLFDGGFAKLKITSNVFSMAWNPAGAASFTLIVQGAESV